jgi:hypothetical protein
VFRASLDFLDSVRHDVRAAYLDILPETMEGWIKKWPASKRAQIEKSIREDYLYPNRVFNMVKREVNFACPSKARCIQYYPTMATQAMMAPQLYALQKAYARVLQSCGDGIRVTFASGMTGSELGSWMSKVLERGRAWFYERDGKSWDSSMGLLHHRLKMYAYGLAGRDVERFVDQGYSVLGRGRYGPERMLYRVVGTTKSGHNDTTLGNSLVNFAIAFEVMTVMGLRGDIIVAGDDLLVAVETDFDEREFARLESEYGIVPEYRKFDFYGDVSFISGIFVPSRFGIAFVPKPGRLFAKLFWSVRPPSRKKEALYRHSVVQGLNPTCSGLPVVGRFLSVHDSVQERVIGTDKYHAHFASAVEYDEKIWEHFARRYGLLEVEFALAEERLRFGVGLLIDPVIERMTEVDCAELDQRKVVGTSYLGGTHDPRLSV